MCQSKSVTQPENYTQNTIDYYCVGVIWDIFIPKGLLFFPKLICLIFLYWVSGYACKFEYIICFTYVQCACTCVCVHKHPVCQYSMKHPLNLSSTMGLGSITNFENWLVCSREVDTVPYLARGYNQSINSSISALGNSLEVRKKGIWPGSATEFFSTKKELHHFWGKNTLTWKLNFLKMLKQNVFLRNIPKCVIIKACKHAQSWVIIKEPQTFLHIFTDCEFQMFPTWNMKYVLTVNVVSQAIQKMYFPIRARMLLWW